MKSNCHIDDLEKDHLIRGRQRRSMKRFTSSCSRMSLLCSSSVSENESNIDLRSKVIVKRMRSKTLSSSSSHRETRNSRKNDDRSNYRDLYEEINFVDFKSYSHMNRVLVALSIDDSLELNFSHISKSRFYKKARKSNE